MWMSIFLGVPLLWTIAGFAASNECLECHDEELSKTFKHQAAVEDCSSCHNPDHDARTGHPYRLYDKPNKLCLSCHTFTPGYSSYGRPTSGHMTGNHPTSGAKDPHYPEKEFNCISCHNPHSSKMETLFRYDYSRDTVYKGELCAVCHWNILYPGQPPKTPSWYQ